MFGIRNYWAHKSRHKNWPNLDQNSVQIVASGYQGLKMSGPQHFKLWLQRLRLTIIVEELYRKVEVHCEQPQSHTNRAGNISFESLRSKDLLGINYNRPYRCQFFKPTFNDNETNNFFFKTRIQYLYCKELKSLDIWVQVVT